jgi:hypothetical protein
VLKFLQILGDSTSVGTLNFKSPDCLANFIIKYLCCLFDRNEI